MTATPPRLEQNVPLAPFTTIGIGGRARFFVRATTEEEVAAALRWARQSATPLFILGGGSNLVISDAGFPGLVLRVEIRGISVQEQGGEVEVSAAAGEEWDRFVAEMVRRDLAGLECLSGIPGLVGGTPIQNVGAYGQEVSETIIRVRAIDVQDGTIRTFTNEDCGFAYRDSIFKRDWKGRFAILAVAFRLQRGAAPAIRYPDLERELEARGDAPTLAAVRDAVIAVRRRKGMVFDPADPDSRSDGSFFMNPILSPPEFERFRGRLAELGLPPEARPPTYPAANGGVKVSAAWLIEQAGFQKGLVRGRVGISSRHTLALVNRGGGTAGELLELVDEIRTGVRNRFGIELHPEPNFVGFS